MKSSNLRNIAKDVLELEILALKKLRKSINKTFEDAVNAIVNCKSKVIVCGVGKSYLIASKVSSTMSSVGCASFSINANECSHGDLGSMTRKDVLIIISNSGKTEELKPVIQYANRNKINLIGITSKKNSLLYNASDIKLLIPEVKEAGLSIVPTSSTTEQIALGDCLAIAALNKKKFSKLGDLKLKNETIKGIIFDLGYSYTQIKNKAKGLSFNSTGNLNMRMGMNDFSAHDVINKLKKEELEKIFYFFGEEKEAKKIAFQIVKERSKKKIDTQGLVELIDRTKKFKNYKIHAATKTFQALRIFVNHEISELIQGLISASKILKKDGVLAVVTFHSLEDKIVKYFFKSLSSNKSISRYLPKLEQPKVLFTMNQKKPILPSISEIKKNIPSRSAKLRYVIKKENLYQFDTDIREKFSHLIDIESFGKNL